MDPYTNVEWSPRAARDLDALHDYIAAERPKVAADMKRRLVKAADGLANYPDQGRPAGRSRELVTVYPFVIRYRRVHGRVVIVRVKHGRQR